MSFKEQNLLISDRLLDGNGDSNHESVAIHVSGVSKCYHLYAKAQDRLKQSIYPLLQRMLGTPIKNYAREFWALRDISFEVKKGETVGIIGRNGSGKSTLLQIICGTLAPTNGTVETQGRLAALLELGAGFNPEFTGRENIYINASIMGLSKEEIREKYDSIVTFADIEDFIDQPVKTYSSGMFVRLAFAVAVSIEPDVLIVDEALSVGDIAFRNKCLLRIKELRDRGVTVLFVSHDLSTLQLICDKVVWLNSGEIVVIGEPVSVTQEYYVSTIAKNSEKFGDGLGVVPQQETGMAKFIQFKLDHPHPEGRPIFATGEDITFRFALLACQPLKEVVFAVSIYRCDGDWVIGQTSREAGVFWPEAVAGMVLSGLLILDHNCLGPGDYMAAFGAYPADHSLCYALTELSVSFSVRAEFPTWGKFIHPCRWMRTDGDNRN